MTTERSVWLEAVKEVFTPASLFQIAGIMYFVVGLCVVVYVLFRYRWSRPQPGDKIPWPRSENPQQGLRLFFMTGGFHPILFFLQVILWPVWISFLWAYEPDPDDPDDEAPRVEDSTSQAVADPVLVSRMETTQDRFRILWLAAVPLVFAVFQAYRIAQAPPDARPFKIVSILSILSVFVGMVLFKFFYPERRISRVAVAAIALLLIAIAVLFRHH